MPLIPALERQKQANLCGFKASLVCIVSSRTGSKATKRNSVLKKTKREREKERERQTDRKNCGAFAQYTQW